MLIGLEKPRIPSREPRPRKPRGARPAGDAPGVGPQLPRPDALGGGAHQGKPTPGHPAEWLGRERKRTGPEGPTKLIRKAKKLGEERTTEEGSSPAPGVHPEPAGPCRETRGHRGVAAPSTLMLRRSMNYVHLAPAPLPHGRLTRAGSSAA